MSASEPHALSRMLEIRQVISRPRVLTWMRRTFAGAFVALGVKLAFADR